MADNKALLMAYNNIINPYGLDADYDNLINYPINYSDLQDQESQATSITFKKIVAAEKKVNN